MNTDQLSILSIFGLVIAWITLYVKLVRTKKANKVAVRILWITTIVVCGIVVAGNANRFGKWFNGGKPLSSGEAKPASPVLFEEANVREALKSALTFEMLDIYEHPEDFDTKYRTRLPNHWLVREQGGKAFDQVESAVTRLNGRGEKYGSSANLDSLEFLDMKVLEDTATVQTRERWYLPVVERNGTPRSGRDVSDPKKDWKITYKMRKINGRWLIVETTAPYKQGP